jgi:hypothetical protein
MLMVIKRIQLLKKKRIGLMNGITIIHGMKIKKEYNSNGRRVKKNFADYSQDQIQRAEARKNKEHNLKKKHLLAMFMHFDGDQFDVNKHYKNEWIKKI